MEGNMKELWLAKAFREWKSDDLRSRQWLPSSKHPVDPIYFADEELPPLTPIAGVGELTLGEYFHNPTNPELLQALEQGVSAPILRFSRDINMSEVLDRVRLDWIEAQAIQAEASAKIEGLQVRQYFTDELLPGHLPAFEVADLSEPIQALRTLVDKLEAFAKRYSDYAGNLAISVHAGDDHILNMCVSRACHYLASEKLKKSKVELEFWLRPEGQDLGLDSIRLAQVVTAGFCSPVRRMVLDLREVKEESHQRTLRYVYHTLKTENKMETHADPVQGSYFFHQLIHRLIQEAK